MTTYPTLLTSVPIFNKSGAPLFIAIDVFPGRSVSVHIPAYQTEWVRREIAIAGLSTLVDLRQKGTIDFVLEDIAYPITLDIGYTGMLLIVGDTGPRGLPGDTGSPGIDGTSGPRGETGPPGAGYTGLRGPTGFRGVTGHQGLTGVQGDTGYTGVQGLTGPEGPRGMLGFTGLDGSTGPMGVTGLIGPGGATGQLGVWGHTGVQGNRGATGVPGPAGDSTGTPGATGMQGAPGSTGVVGVPGPSGSTGPNGPSGETGLPGYTGLQGYGVTGPGGIQGVTGAAAPTPTGSTRFGHFSFRLGEGASVADRISGFVADLPMGWSLSDGTDPDVDPQLAGSPDDLVVYHGDVGPAQFLGVAVSLSLVDVRASGPTSVLGYTPFDAGDTPTLKTNLSKTQTKLLGFQPITDPSRQIIVCIVLFGA